MADVVVMGRDRLKRETNSRGQVIGGVAFQPTSERPRRTDPVEDIFREMFGAMDLEVEGAKKQSEKGPIAKYRVSYKERGRQKEATVTIDRSEQLGDTIEVCAEFVRIVKDQPVAKSITAERVIVPPGSHDIQEAEFAAVLSYISWPRIQQLQKSGHWANLTNDKMAKLRDLFEDEKGFQKEDLGGAYYQVGAFDEIEAQWDQDAYVGVDTEAFRKRLVPVLKIFRQWPILKDKKVMPEAALTILPRQNMIARFHYTSVDTGRGTKSFKRPLIAHHFIRARNEFYGISLPRFIEPIQEELNAVANLDLDAGTLRSIPFMFADHTAVINRDNEGYYPGMVAKCANPAQNIFVPQFGPGLDLIRHKQELWAYGQDLTVIGASESVGRTPDRPQQNRTARGALILQGERQFAVAYSGEDLGYHVREFWKMVQDMNTVNAPIGKMFTIFGETEPTEIERREQLRGEFEYKFDAGSAVLNDEIKRILFTEAFQLVAPIAAASPEQITMPLYRLAKKIMEDRGIKNPEQYLPEPIVDFGPPLQPEIEHRIFAMGRRVPVHPLDVDAFHIQRHMEFIASPAIGELPQAALLWFQEHIQEHHRRETAASTRGQAAPGRTGAMLGGRMAFGQNPAIAAGPGAAPTMQPSLPGEAGGPGETISVLNGG